MKNVKSADNQIVSETKTVQWAGIVVASTSVKLALIFAVVCSVVALIENVRFQRGVRPLSLVFSTPTPPDDVEIVCQDVWGNRVSGQSEGSDVSFSGYVENLFFIVHAPRPPESMPFEIRTERYSLRNQPNAAHWTPSPTENNTFFLFLKPHLPQSGGFFGDFLNWPGDFSFFGRILGPWPLVFFLIFLAAFEDRRRRNDPVSIPRHRFALETFATLLFVSTGLALAVFLIGCCYRPDLEAVRHELEGLTFSAITPEPVERLQFNVALLLAPVLLLLVQPVVAAVVARWDAERQRQVFVGGAFAVTISLLVLVVEFGYFPTMQPGFMISRGLLFLVYGLFLLPILVAAFFCPRLERGLAVFMGILSLLILVPLFLLRIYSVNFLPEAVHFTAVYYAATQMMVGKVFFVDLYSLYGSFAMFLEPLFRLIGYGVFPFTLTLSALSVVSYVLFYLSLCLLVESKLLRCCGFLTLVAYTFFLFAPGQFMSLAAEGGIYYFDTQAHYMVVPLRSFPLALGLYLMLRTFRVPSAANFHATTLVVAAAPFWNVEIGVVLWIAWGAVLCFEALLRSRSSGKRFGIFIATSFAVWGFFYVYLFLRAGRPPDFSLMFRLPALFQKIGVFARSMPLFHAWNFVVLLYLFGLFEGVRLLGERWRGRPIDASTAFFVKAGLLCSLIGLGLFPYYVGGSYDENLVRIMFPAIIFFLMLTDRLRLYLLADERPDQYGFGVPFVAFLGAIFLVGLGPLFLLMQSDFLYKMVRTNLVCLSSPTDAPSFADIRFLQKNSVPGERVLILRDSYDGIYYGESRTRCAVDVPSSVETMLYDDLETIETFLEQNSNVKVFAAMNELPHKKERAIPYPGPDVSLPMKKILETDYESVDRCEQGTLTFLQKRCSSPTVNPSKPTP